jgi:hypothetical protein
MLRKAVAATVVLATSLITIHLAMARQQIPATNRVDAKTQIQRLVGTYVQSIIDADAKLGASVWSPTPDVSFIEPRGSEQGWAHIATEFYGKTMGEMFTKRTLKVVGEPNIQVYESAAVVQFNWDFVAILGANGQSIHTTGRESQVYVNLPGTGWRLVHVHYSGPPLGAPTQGF